MPLLTTLYGTVTLCLQYHQHLLLQGDEPRRPSRVLLPGRGGERKLVGREREEEGAIEAERLQSAGSPSSWGTTPLRMSSTGSLAPRTERSHSAGVGFHFTSPCFWSGPAGSGAVWTLKGQQREVRAGLQPPKLRVQLEMKLLVKCD